MASERLKNLFSNNQITAGTIQSAAQNPAAPAPVAPPSRLPTVSVSGAPIDRGRDLRFAPNARLPVSGWSANKEAAAVAGRNVREGAYSGPSRAQNVAAAMADGTFSTLQTKFNAENPGQFMDDAGTITGQAAAARPILNSVTTPAASRLPQLTAAEIASGASVSVPGAPLLGGQVIAGGQVRTDNMPGTGSIRLPGYENPSSISYEGDNIVVRNEGAYTRPTPVEDRITSAGLDPKSAAAQTVRLEEAKTQTAVEKAKATQLKAQEKAAQQAQKAREQAVKGAQQTGSQIAERLPSTVSARLSAIMGGQAQTSVRSRLPSFRSRK
jgi:hypothetical protein